MVNELMELLHTEKQYDKLYEYAMMTVGIDPESPITIYWLIVALRLHGAAEMASGTWSLPSFVCLKNTKSWKHG